MKFDQPLNASTRSGVTDLQNRAGSGRASRGPGGFKTREVVDLLGLSRRQLQYWAKTGLVEPSERTRGGHNRYSFDDLVALKSTKRLIDAGISVQKIRSSVTTLRNLLRQVDRPLAEVVLVATEDVVLIFPQDTIFEALSGQEWIFEVAEFEREVRAYRSEGNAARETSRTDETALRVDPPGSQKAEDLPARPGPRPTRRAGKVARAAGI